MQGVIIFPALILMAGWSHSPPSSHPRAEDPPRAFEKKENVRVTRDSRSRPLRRERSVVPRVIRTGEKKLAKLNVRPCLGAAARKDRRAARQTLPLPPTSCRRIHFPSGTDYLRLIIRAAARKVRIGESENVDAAKENPRSIRNRSNSMKSWASGYIALE